MLLAASGGSGSGGQAEGSRSVTSHDFYEVVRMSLADSRSLWLFVKFWILSLQPGDVLGIAEYIDIICVVYRIYCNIVIHPVCVVCRVTNIIIKCIIGSTVIIPSVPQHRSLHIPGFVDPCLPLCQHRAWG